MTPIKFHKTGQTVSKYNCHDDVPCLGEHVLVINEEVVHSMIAAYDEMMTNHGGEPNEEIGDPVDDMVEYLRTFVA